MTLLIESNGRPATGGDSPLPRPSYPRPDRDRSERWLSLNGVWDFEHEDGTAEILVPFAWETPASG
ncbi:MAG TPA: hypothetical protein VIL55_11000, partial [Naasia sp.]